MSRFERILLTVTFFIPYLLFPAGTLHLWFSTTKVRQKTRMTKYSVFAWLPYKGKKRSPSFCCVVLLHTMSVSQLNVLSHKIYLNLNVIWFYWIRHFGCLNKYFEFSSVWANRLLLMNFWYTIWYFAAILSFCYLLQNNYDLWSIYKPQERIKLLFFIVSCIFLEMTLFS